MGLFNELGRRIGKFEQEARAAATDDAEWGCRNCGSTFDETSDVCPDCGSEQVVALGADDVADGDDSDGEAAEADGEASDDRPAEDGPL